MSPDIFTWTRTVAFFTHLSCGFCPLPDAKVADDPGDEQAQGQVPVHRAHVVNAWGNPQHSSPAEARKKRRKCIILIFRTRNASPRGGKAP